jgi:hypothetical protein
MSASGWNSGGRYPLRGETVEAEPYRLKAEELDITVWYTTEGACIGLESDTGIRRTLRYEGV